MGAVRTFWARVSSRISALTRTSKAVLAAAALPLLILGFTAVPSGRALAQPVPVRSAAAQAVTTARTGTVARYSASQLAAFHAFHLHHLAHLAHLRALAQAKAALAVTVSVTSHASSIAGDSEPDSDGASTVTAQAPAHLTTQQAPSSTGGGYSVSSGFQACVIRAESGGNPQIWNASGHWGLYQFSYSTWVAHGGASSLFGHADGAYQTQIFWNTVRQDGTSDWAPYDGC